MVTYSLFLDESGNFKEQSKLPSIVAGYLVKGYFDDNDWARALMEEVKASDPKFININTDSFHGMDDYSMEMKEYCAAVLEGLVKREARIVAFKSKRNRIVVNSDVTYLNVFSTGLIKLLEQLRVEAQDKVKLNIYYAHRIKVVLKEAYDIKERIEENSYRDRIEEHIVLKEMQLPAEIKNSFEYSLKTGNAKYVPLLMLADAVNYGLRGGWTNFSKEIKERIRQLPTLVFQVNENARWEQIKNNFHQDNLATAVFSWYSEEDPELLENNSAFEEMLKAALGNMRRNNLQLQLEMLGNKIKTVINLRQFYLANRIISRLVGEFIPMLQICEFPHEAFSFDLYFYRLTSATHQGDTIEEIRCIEICNAILPKIALDFNKISYLVDYKLRVAEHLKNIFEFAEAIKVLDRLIAQQKDLIESLGLIPGLESWAEQVKSKTLGKLYGSRLAARTYLPASKEQYALAQEDYIGAMEQFTHRSDQIRQYQNLCMLEYKYGNLESALELLAQAAGIDKNFGPEEILEAILDNKDNIDFLLLHYTNLMAQAVKAGGALGKGMFKAWAASKAETFLKNRKTVAGAAVAEYPYYVIYWRIAEVRALLNLNPNNYFKIAEKSAFFNSRNFTIYAAGLAINVERMAFIYNKIGANEINSFKNKLQEFLKLEPPMQFVKVFEPWLRELEAIKGRPLKEQKAVLLKLANSVPIL